MSRRRRAILVSLLLVPGLIGIGPLSRRDRRLESLHRIAALARRDTARLDDPAAALEALRRRLIPKRASRGGYRFEEGPPSFLSPMLETQCGNPLAHALLLLSVGDRIGLRLHPRCSAEAGLFVSPEAQDALSRRELLSLVCLAKARGLLRRGHYEAACRAAEQAIRLHGPSGGAHLVLAVALFEQGRPTRAVHRRRRALGLD